MSGVTPPVGIRILGLASDGVGGNGTPPLTGFENEWLAEYDPRRGGLDKHGRPMVAFIRTTPDPRGALSFHSVEAARDCWAQPVGVRADGKPDRPLTAFTVQVASLPR
jgi:hypothetical protein